MVLDNFMKNQEFSLEGAPHIALCDLLKAAGAADSGGAAKMHIAAGEVLRNGAVETRKTAKICAGEEIVFGTIRIEVRA